MDETNTGHRPGVNLGIHTVDGNFWAFIVSSFLFYNSRKRTYRSCGLDECILFFSRFFIVNAGIVYLYFSGYQKVDEEEYGGAWELTKEGFMTSFAGFLVSTSIEII